MTEEKSVFESEEFKNLDQEAQDDKIFEVAEKERIEEEKKRDPNYVPPDEDTKIEDSPDDTDDTPKKEIDEEEEKPADEEKDDEVVKDTEDDGASDEETPKDSEISEEERLTEMVKSYALKHNVSEDDAKKDIDSIGKITEKYGKDSFELAKANLYLQRMVSYNQQELKALKEPQDGFYSDHIVIEGKRINKDVVIADHKKTFPNKTDGEDDDTVFEMAKEIYETKVKTWIDIQRKEIPAKANAIREGALGKLSGDLKQYESEIKEMLYAMDDTGIVQPNFNPHSVVTYVEGLHAKENIKAAEEAGYQRGLKQSKILGEKSETVKPSGKTKSESKKSSGLTDAQKDEALDMYDGSNIPDETKFAYYKEQLDHEKSLKNKLAS